MLCRPTLRDRTSIVIWEKKQQLVRFLGLACLFAFESFPWVLVSLQRLSEPRQSSKLLSHVKTGTGISQECLKGSDTQEIIHDNYARSFVT